MTPPARDVRVRALWRDDPTEAPLTVDLRIEEEDGRIVSTWDVFGAFDLVGASRRPFILRRDGALDLGVAAPGLAWRTDLRDKAIKVGARFLVRWNETDVGEYEIVKIAELGTKDARS